MVKLIFIETITETAREYNYKKPKHLELGNILCLLGEYYPLLCTSKLHHQPTQVHMSLQLEVCQLLRQSQHQ